MFSKLNNKNKKETNPELEKKKAYLFFGFYAIFFIVLMIMVRTSPTPTEVNKNETNPTPTPVVEQKEAYSNYEFVYSLTLGEETYVYTGKKYDHKEHFTLVTTEGSNTYYKTGNNYFVKTEEGYTLGKNPYKYQELLDFTYLQELIDVSTLIENEENKKVLELDNQKLLDDLFKDAIYDGFSLENVEKNIMTITANKDYVEKIEINLDNMMNFVNNTRKDGITKMSLTIELFNVDKVKDFEME